MKRLTVLSLVALVLLAGAATWTVGQAVRTLPNIVLLNEKTDCTLNYNEPIDYFDWIVRDASGEVVFTTNQEWQAVDYLLNDCGRGARRYSR